MSEKKARALPPYESVGTASAPSPASGSVGARPVAQAALAADTLALYGGILAAGADRRTGPGHLPRVPACREPPPHDGPRRGLAITDDMPRLREALAALVDQDVPLATRLDRLRPRGGRPMVKGLGPSVITTILHLMDPRRDGILNGTKRESDAPPLGPSPGLAASASSAERLTCSHSTPNCCAWPTPSGSTSGLLDALWWRVPPQHLAPATVPRSASL